MAGEILAPMTTLEGANKGVLEYSRAGDGNEIGKIFPAYDSKTINSVVEKMKFFAKPEVNIGILRAYNVYLDCVSPLDLTSSKDVEFQVPAHTSHFIDMGKMELIMKVQIKKKTPDNTLGNDFKQGPGDRSIETQFEDVKFPASFTAEPNSESQNESDRSAAEFVVPIDCFFQTQWSNLILKLNNEVITSTSQDFGYQSYMEILLRTEEAAMENLTHKWLFTKDSGRKRKTDVHPYRSENRGAVMRSRRVRSRNMVQLGGRIFTDFFKNPELLLLNGVAINLRLTPAEDKFRFNVFPESLNTQFEYKIHSIQLKIPYVTLNEDSLRGCANILNDTPVYYKYVRNDFKYVPLTQGIREIKLPDLFDKRIPIDLVLAMVDAERHYGNFQLDPFFFNRNNVEQVAFYLDNVSIPELPIEFGDSRESVLVENEENFNSDEWAYQALSSLHAVAGTKFNGFNQYTYNDGNFLICLQTDPTVKSTVDLWPVPKIGNTSLYIRFREPIEKQQHLLILARFPAVVTIDKKRTVKRWL